MPRLWSTCECANNIIIHEILNSRVSAKTHAVAYALPVHSKHTHTHTLGGMTDLAGSSSWAREQFGAHTCQPSVSHTLRRGINLIYDVIRIPLLILFRLSVGCDRHLMMMCAHHGKWRASPRNSYIIMRIQNLPGYCFKIRIRTCGVVRGADYIIPG